MTRKRQKFDSAVAPPATAQERNLKAIGDFKLHSRLVAATKAVAHKKLHATTPGDLLALILQRILLSHAIILLPRSVILPDPTLEHTLEHTLLRL